MTEDESEVFEITDFTTASDWERFIARFEEIIHDWKLTTAGPYVPLSKNELSSAEWEESSQEIYFADFKFIVSHHKVKSKVVEPEKEEKTEEKGDGKPPRKTSSQTEVAESQEQVIPVAWRDMMSSDNDFPARAHCLCRWYGLREFVVLSAAPGMADLTAESRVNILLSSVSIAINNTGCLVPVFIQVHYPKRKLFTGCLEVPGFRTTFEMVHLKNIPGQYKNLSGLLDIFKSKMACPITPVPAVLVAVRFTYQLSDWMHYSLSQMPPDVNSYSGDELGLNEFGELPFGACEDPVSELQLSTTWPCLSEEMVVDNDVYTDLDPLHAPLWSVRVLMQDNTLCLLGDYLLEFVKLCRRAESIDQLLPQSALTPSTEEVDVSQALDRLTNPKYKVPSLGTVVTRATSKLQMQPEEAPIPKDLLNEILMFIFPDARADAEKLGKGKSTPPHTVVDSKPTQQAAEGNSAVGESMELFKQFKSAPTGSFLSRLAVCMCVVNHSYGGLRALAHLWQEVVLEMRYRWENNYTVPDMDPGPPNMGCSLLYQKFQMLNCCIERKKTREAAAGTLGKSRSPRSAQSQDSSIAGSSSRKRDNDNNASTAATAAVKELLERSVSISSSDDEFYECNTDEEEAGNDDDNNDGKATTSKNKKGKKGKDANTSKEEEEEEDTTEPMNISQSTETTENTENKDSTNKDSTKKDSTIDSTSTSTSSNEKLNAEKPKPEKRMSSSMDVSSFMDTLTHQAEGRLKEFGLLRLLNVPAEKLYVPVTQEPALMTEDMLEEHAVVLEKLGTSSEGAHLRARMQSACLLSDMESFKAANPGAVLGDFVRWYSPRDWVIEEEEDEEGNVITTEQLSQRMQIPGNMWLEVWNSAQPVPARRQRRLFDDTKEAEKVLHYLASLRPADVVMRLMPMLIHAAFVKLTQQEESALPSIQKLLESTATKAANAMRMPKMEVKKFEELAALLGRAEELVTRAQSLQQKLDAETADTGVTSADVHGFVQLLMERPEVQADGAAQGPLGMLVHRLFQTAQKSAYMVSEEDLAENNASSTTSPSMMSSSSTFPPTSQTPQNVPDFPAPAAREYVLRAGAIQRPSPWSRPSPQRMLAVIVKDEVRLAGAFSSDTTFQ